MFKKLVVGALATGFLLTGGIGASAATSTVDNTIKKLDSPQFSSYQIYDYHSSCPQIDAPYKMSMRKIDGIFANSFTDPSSGITWYFKGFGKYDRTIGCYGGTKC
ncbi:LCI fold-containing protein [Bacillus thuringiensis]|uniref:LCI fold-containing protein n=1 Tax=Bacillus thuringiensis TaxID=1428 RepID=UPI000CD9B1E0|nr:LCI fold-containing protein [Bacillus thuringiensis]